MEKKHQEDRFKTKSLLQGGEVTERKKYREIQGCQLPASEWMIQFTHSEEGEYPGLVEACH